MKCHDAERWISRSLDGDLSRDEQAELEAHFADCDSCRQTQSDWQDYGSRMRERPAPAGPMPGASASVSQGAAGIGVILQGA